MRSITREGAADLSTRARIRDAAIEVFATRGFAEPVRAVAAAAGVSAPLVIHHFGSKAGLRSACDEQVLALIRRTKSEVLRDGRSEAFLQVLATTEEYAVTMGYVLRSLMGGGDLAREFVQHLMADASATMEEGVRAGHIRPSTDEARRVRYLTLGALGAMLLSFTLDPPEDLSDLRSALGRHLDEVALPALELYTDGLLTSRRLLDDYLLHVPDPPGSDPAAPA